MARDAKEYDEFVDKVEEHSLWRQGNKPKYGEQMLMLSTCGYWEKSVLKLYK